jgi:hypothetical protein
MLWLYRASAIAVIVAPFITGDVGWVMEIARPLAGLAVFLDFANILKRYALSSRLETIRPPDRRGRPGSGGVPTRI